MQMEAIEGSFPLSFSSSLNDSVVEAPSEETCTTPGEFPPASLPDLSSAGRHSVDESNNPCRVFVGGISWKVDDAALKKFFQTFGDVSECKIIVDRETSKSKGYGFVTFGDVSVAEHVKALGKISFLNKSMNVGDAIRKVPPARNHSYPSGRKSYYPHQQHLNNPLFSPPSFEYSYGGSSTMYPPQNVPIFYPNLGPIPHPSTGEGAYYPPGMISPPYMLYNNQLHNFLPPHFFPPMGNDQQQFELYNQSCQQQFLHPPPMIFPTMDHLNVSSSSSIDDEIHVLTTNPPPISDSFAGMPPQSDPLLPSIGIVNRNNGE